jgi:hypothetical protein
MLHLKSIAAIVLAAALLTTIAPAQAFDESRYPDLNGQWSRAHPRSQWDPSKPRGLQQQAPLTAEYQAIFEANLADLHSGNLGADPQVFCLPSGMPRMMIAYEPIELIITVETVYIHTDHLGDFRRIYTDGRDWPAKIKPSFEGYSIGKWVDEDGDGKFDVLEVETRYLKLPRGYDITGIPFHEDGNAVIKERIYLDKANPNKMYDEITVIDNALTKPYVKMQTGFRNPDPRPIWKSDVCSEFNTHVRIGTENYYLSADGKLMPAKKNQAPPDLSYFQRTQ